MKLLLPEKSGSLSCLIVYYAIENNSLELQWGKGAVLTVNNLEFKSDSSIYRYLTRHFKKLCGISIMEECEIDHWISFAIGSLSCNSLSQDCVAYLEKCLSPVTFLVGKDCTLADIIIWSTLYVNPNWEKLQAQGTVPPNLSRWYSLIQSLDFVSKAVSALPNPKVSQGKSSNVKCKEEGKFVELPGAEPGKVVVRFPPEASGYLHIGHAKAALLNQYYQEAFSGKLIMRFDDTNPAKEKVDFERVILEDLELLQIKPDEFTHTSNYFEVMLDMCEQLIKEGKAYVDDTDPELMKKEREQRMASKNRDNSMKVNLKLWDEMKKGSDVGQKCCVRAKIDMSSDNGCMRDPAIYRCKNELHPRTGDKFKAYPTYDFACPIVDSLEGVTHCLRTTEYHDRDEQFFWFIDALGLRMPYIWEYARLNMTNTVLSKRKLRWFVENGHVDGWDDPRFPTVRGVLRRGMTVEGLKQFVIAQGSSKSVVVMEWDKIWSFNKKVIDPIAPRYTAIHANKHIPVIITGVEEKEVKAPKHPKNPEVGEKNLWLGPKILIDECDAIQLKEGENVTFINWGNIRITKLVEENGQLTKVLGEPDLENKDYKKTLKLTWIAETSKSQLVPCVCVYFDHIISKPVLGKDEDFKQYIMHTTKIEEPMLGDHELISLKKSDIIQLQRRGFFICDSPYRPPSVHTGRSSPLILFSIPDGHSKQTPASDQFKKEENVNKECINTESTSINISKLSEDIQVQGNIVRELKKDKAEKASVDIEVKKLLRLKALFKEKSGRDWTPGDSLLEDVNSLDISNKITEVGNKIRNLKSIKADKNVIAEEVKALLQLKNCYKSITGKDWVPPTGEPQAKIMDNTKIYELTQKITSQSDKIRQLKSTGVTSITDVNLLLKLKCDYKSLTGKDWVSDTDLANKTASPTDLDSSSKQSSGASLEDTVLRIKQQGDLVRQLKSSSALKEEINEAVQKLLALKGEYKSISGSEYPNESKGKVPESKGNKKIKDSKKSNDGCKNLNQSKAQMIPVLDCSGDSMSLLKKVTRLGLEAKKEENLPDWYSQVIVKGELIEYYDVSGCYILRPWSFAIWESIRNWFDDEIKKLGVMNCYFPIFVSKSVLEKEKTHIADFAPEVAWVTKSGDSDLAEPIAIRPTSETVMYPAYAKWVQSYRDLPIKLNQWNNVVRWEFKHPQPFLRTREFLWQEGHTAYASMKDALEEVQTILDLYARIYEDLLAVPVVKGRKTEKEKFAGGDFTYTIEAFISASGRAIQGATSHHLGQNFSKMFDIVFEDPETKEKKFVYQNSWGITTRTIGVLIMVHADNQGLLLPPKVATIQVVVVPCGITASLKNSEGEQALLNACKDVGNQLLGAGVRVHVDYRDNYSAGWKFNHWELKGVPLRIEIGPKDLKNAQVLTVRRDNGTKEIVSNDKVIAKIKALLDDIQVSLLKRATEELNQHLKVCKEWNNFCPLLDQKNLILSPFCGTINCEDEIKQMSTRENTDVNAPSMGAKSLCIPFDQPNGGVSDADICVNPKCNKKAKFYTLFGRSY